MSFELSDCIVFRTNKASKEFGDEFDKRLRKKGTTRKQWIALYFINERPAINQRDLAQKMNIQDPSLARLIDRMQQKGLVKRVENQTDRREKLLSLTFQGRLFFEELIHEEEKFCDELTRGLTTEELDEFNSIIEKMIKNIKK